MPWAAALAVSRGPPLSHGGKAPVATRPRAALRPLSASSFLFSPEQINLFRNRLQKRRFPFCLLAARQAAARRAARAMPARPAFQVPALQSRLPAGPFFSFLLLASLFVNVYILSIFLFFLLVFSLNSISSTAAPGKTGTFCKEMPISGCIYCIFPDVS